MRYLLSILLLLFINNASAQTIELTTHQLPIRNGRIYEAPLNKGYCSRIQQDGILIIGSNDSCFTTTAGSVVAIVDLGDSCGAILIKDKDSKLHAYANLSQLNLIKGSLVNKGDYLGKVLQNDDNELELTYIITNSKGKHLKRKEMFTFLQSVNRALPCLQQAL
jgi:3-oxoacyl-[acyl-carrier-protein] synthase III